MAQFVEYWQDNVEYLEGPFVIVNAGGYRIEMEVKNHKCPVIASFAIDRYLEKYGFNYHKTNNKNEAIMAVDFLNSQVRIGNIVLVNNWWTPKD